MPRFRPLSNATAVTLALIKQLKVKVTETTLADKLENHPEFPSLLAISDCLTDFAIPHEAYKIDKNDFDATNLEFPFVAHLSTSGVLMFWCIV